MLADSRTPIGRAAKGSLKDVRADDVTPGAAPPSGQGSRRPG